MNNEFPIFFIFCVEFCIFLRIFYEILSGFRDKFQKRVTCVAFFQLNVRKQIRKLLPKILKSVKIIRYYSLIFIRVLRVQDLELPAPDAADREEDFVALDLRSEDLQLRGAATLNLHRLVLVRNAGLLQVHRSGLVIPLTDS